MKLAIVVENLLCTRYFGFAIATLQLFQNPENVKISNFSLYTVPRRKAISSKLFYAFFKNILYRWKMRNDGYCCWKFLVHRDFWVCNSNVTTFPNSRRCKNFNFTLYTVREEILHLQKYLTNFQKNFFGWKTEEEGYFGWKFQLRTNILVLQ